MRVKECEYLVLDKDTNEVVRRGTPKEVAKILKIPNERVYNYWLKRIVINGKYILFRRGYVSASYTDYNDNYYVYDTLDNNELMMTGTIYEIADQFLVQPYYVSKCIRYGNLIGRQYSVKKEEICLQHQS